jgi:hypothetical protein
LRIFGHSLNTIKIKISPYYYYIINSKAQGLKSVHLFFSFSFRNENEIQFFGNILFSFRSGTKMKYYFLEIFNFIFVPKKTRNVNEINFLKIKNFIFVPKIKRNENEIFVNKKTERNEIRYDPKFVVKCGFNTIKFDRSCCRSSSLV